MSRELDQRRLRELFEAACQLPPEECAKFLDAACAGNDDMRAELNSLLGFDRLPGGILSDTRVDAMEHFGRGPRPPAAGGHAPARIARYQLVRRIASGGMGDVYEARQDETARRVAIKLMRPDAESGELIRRFRREGQLQARLTHPCIAAVYEAGVHTEGTHEYPYIAMELVTGPSIVNYCNQAALGLPERVRLMHQVCGAVAHAHRRGVIHRDLKPDNILVEHAEGGPRPKVLDFGVAKLTEHEAPIATRTTEAGRIVGTLSYMSPEQLSGDPGSVDTQSDVYSLGLILYELLAHRPAYDATGVALPEAIRRITQTEPPRLSTISHRLRGDLETIVLKAIDRDKTRRYNSADELGADLQRFLGHEPISARPTSAIYQLSKFVRKNRALAAATALGLLVLLAGTVATAVQARIAIRARDEALLQQQKANHEAEVARAVSDLLRQVFSLAGPDQARGNDPTLRQAIDNIDQLFDERFHGPPEAEATVRNVAGIIQRNFGEFDAAQEQFDKSLAIRRRVFPPDSIEIADSLQNISTLKSISGHPDESIPLLTEALRIQRSALGEDDPIVARSLFNLARTHLRLRHYDEALRLTDESLSLHARIQPDQKDILGMHYEQLASIERETGHLAESEANAVRAVDLVREGSAPDSPSLAVALLTLGRTRLLRGDAAGADAPSSEAQTIVDKVYASSPNHPTRAAVHDLRAKVLQAISTPVPANQAPKDPPSIR